MGHGRAPESGRWKGRGWGVQVVAAAAGKHRRAHVSRVWLTGQQDVRRTARGCGELGGEAGGCIGGGNGRAEEPGTAGAARVPFEVCSVLSADENVGEGDGRGRRRRGHGDELGKTGRRPTGR